MSDYDDLETVSSTDLTDTTDRRLEFPETFLTYLPVRRLVTKYVEEKDVRTKDEEDPEEFFKEVSNSVPIPRRFDPCSEIPIRVKTTDQDNQSALGSPLMLMPPRVKRLGTLNSAMDEIKENVASWTMVRPAVVMRDLPQPLVFLTTLYDGLSVPLYIYEGSALYEQRFNDDVTKAIWSEVFTSCLTGVRRRNLLGTLADNTIVDMRPFERDDDYSIAIDLSLRQYEREWRGFVDPAFTTANLEAGVLRALTSRVHIRVKTARTIRNVQGMLSAAEYVGCTFKEYRVHTRVWMLHVAGAVAYISARSIPKLVQSWKADIHVDMPSLHVFKESRTISITCGNGCLMRQKNVTTMDFDEGSSVWMDSLLFNSEEMREFLDVDTEYLSNPFEFLRFHASLIPYTLFDGLPRPTLGSFMGPQAIALPKTVINSVNSPIEVLAPLVETPAARELRRTGGVMATNPGVNLIVLFANDRRCYEDSVVISQEVNNKEVAHFAGFIRHPVPDNEVPPRVGDVIEPETAWYRIGSRGIVKEVEITADKGVVVTLDLGTEGLRVGDKLATHHGQKQTISAILPAEEMPLCKDIRSGKTFRPHLIMAAVSVHNRETIGQIYEARASLKAVDIEAFDPSESYESYVTLPLGEDCQELTPTECSFSFERGYDSTLSTLKPRGEVCKADYGICRFWVLSHLSRDKQHYASSVPKGVQAPQGKLKGGSVRIGDLDLLTIGAKGLLHSAEELLNSSDACVVSVCQVCERLSLLCDCPEKPSEMKVRDVVTRLGLVKVDICRAVGSIAAFRGTSFESVSELKKYLTEFKGGQRSKTELAASIPTSFKYRT